MTGTWTLPPLILHPFNERVPPATLLENSRAALMLSGLIPNDGTEEEVLHQRVLSGRYAELRMLYFLGKDVLRWLEQCADWAAREPGLETAELSEQSFAELLTLHPPENVREKLLGWGVADHASIFSRAIGLNAVFAEVPAMASLSEDFLRGYHRYVDVIFRCYMEGDGTRRAIDAANFRFELYASGEYSRLLESEWGAE
ncbi:MAG: hypothetical protein KGN36_12235 [Acidobacteriota bacterium]|nr:hypothetical protein [Acidobacteriota bacterium]